MRLVLSCFMHKLTDLYTELIYRLQCRTFFLRKSQIIMYPCGLACCSWVCRVCLACGRSPMPITVIRSAISSSSASFSRAWKNMFIYGHMYKSTYAHAHTNTHTLTPSGTFKHDNVRVPHTSRQPIANLFTLTLCLMSCLFVCVFTWSICHVCASVCLCHVLTICQHRTEDLKHISLRSTQLSLSLSLHGSL